MTDANLNFYVLNQSDRHIAQAIFDTIKKTHIISDSELCKYNDKTKLWETQGTHYNTYLLELVGSMIMNITTAEINILKKKLSKVFNDEDRTRLNIIQKKEKVLLTASKTNSIVTILYGMLKNKNSVQNIKDSLKDHEFPISNGRIIDLKTSKIRERKLEDYCFYESPVSLVDKTPNADKFFGSLMKFDKDLVDVLQTILGYSITGSTDEKAFFIMYGSTANNGKSTLVSVLQSILGPYYHTGNKSLIIQEKNKSDNKPEEAEH
tara:strand:+ start:9 stop:800 length:792 start_codon:yes stop_codon:yes gene_type:complete